MPSASSLKKAAAARLHDPKGAASAGEFTAAGGGAVDPIELRVLVLATTGDPNPDGVHVVPGGSWDWDLSTLTSALDYAGVPYDVYKSTTKELCSHGTWKLDWSANANATSTTCSSGDVTTWDAGVTADKLWDGGVHAYYEGVMQTNGTLSYVDPVSGAFVSSALTATEWADLWTMEAQFGIRTVSANTYPTADFGLTYKGEDGNATTARWTSAGAAAFPYVNASGALAINNAYTYRASASATDTTTSVLLNDAAGDALAVVHTYPTQGNRQTLALTFDSAGYLLHGEVLGYGLVNWVTKGLFLGERHAYLAPQPDDLFISDSVWQPSTPCGTRPDDPSLPEYRITGTDLTSLASWQTQTTKPAISKNFRIEFPFNGAGQTAAWLAENGITNDTLTPTVKKLKGQFAFVNHTWDHQNLDGRTVSVNVVTTNGVTTISAGAFEFTNSWGHTVVGTGIPAGATIVDVSVDGTTATLSSPATQDGTGVPLWVGVTYDQAKSEIAQNNALAQALGLGNFSTTNLIQPDISGLGNQDFLQAAYDSGVRYLISDTSRTGDPHQYGVNEGRLNTGTYDPTLPGAATAGAHGSNYSLLEIARYPTNLYFNVRTPAQWLAEDNCLYPADAFGHVTSYQQLIDRESSVLVKYLLQGANRPLMFHQPNVSAYTNGHSLFSDLINATLTKYSQLVKAPVLSPTMNQLGQKMTDRMAYNQALATGLSASIVPGVSITITNNSTVAAKVPVTGLNAGAAYGAEKYAGQNISYVPVAPGQSVTLALH